jgi:N-acetylneuraminate synthase
VTNDVFVIAEIGLNHNGSVSVAQRLIEVAAESGADAVKFQLRNLPTLYTSMQGTLDIGVQYVKDAVERYGLTPEETLLLMRYAEGLGLVALCTPFDEVSLDLLVEGGVSGLKIASADFTNHELIERAIETGLPTLVSTGMATEGEVIGGCRLIRGIALRGQVALLHCNSSYPAPFADLNLSYISHLRELSGLVTGFSGHERGIAASICAIGVGARILERHLTLDSTQDGPDHRASLEPGEFANLCLAVRDASAALGTPNPRELSQGERLNRLALGKSCVAALSLTPGTTLTRAHIQVRSPGTGLPPYRAQDLIGRTITRQVSEGEPFVEEDLVGWSTHHVKFGFSRPWGVPVRFHDYETLLERMTPDFLEFHLGRDDLNFSFEAPRVDLSRFALKVHSPDVFPNDHLLDLANSDPRHAETSLRWLQHVLDKTVEWAERFDGAVTPVVIASVGGFSTHERMDVGEVSEAYERLGNNLDKLNLRGVDLAMQTLPPFPWYFGGQLHCNLFVDPESTAKFAERSGHALCLDVSHTQMSCSWMGSSLYEAVAMLLPHSIHLHLADATGVSGEGVQIGEGDIDFAAIAELLAKMAPGVPFIPEIWQGHLRNGAGFIEGLRRLEMFLS